MPLSTPLRRSPPAALLRMTAAWRRSVGRRRRGSHWLCFAGAIPLTLYYRMFWQKRRVAVDMFQLLAAVAAVVVVTLLLVASMRVRGGLPWAQALHQAPLLAVSAQSTAGFFLDAVLAIGSRVEAGGDFLDDRGRRSRIHRRGIPSCCGS